MDFIDISFMVISMASTIKQMMFEVIDKVMRTIVKAFIKVFIIKGMHLKLNNLIKELGLFMVELTSMNQ